MIKEGFKDAFKRHAFFPRTKIDYWTLRKLRSLKSKTVGTKSWAEYFKYITRDVHLNPTLHERVQEGTAKTLLPKWMENFANNLPFIRYGDEINMQLPNLCKQTTIADLVRPPPLLDFEPDFEAADGPVEEFEGLKVKNPPEGSAVVVGRGPSLFQHEHCKQLAESNYKGMVVASDGGLIPLLESGVVPYAVVTVDGAEVIKKYFDHPLVKKLGSKIKWLASVTVHHDVYLAARKAGMPVFWFNPMFDDWRQNESWTKLQVLMTRTPKFPLGVPRANSGGNAGACAWIMAMSLLKRAPIALIGIDFGYPEGTPLEKTQYYSSVLKEAGDDVALIKRTYKQFRHPFFKTEAFTDIVFYHYRQAFLELQQATSLWYRHYGGTINCTGGGTLFGLGITNMHFKQFLDKYSK